MSTRLQFGGMTYVIRKCAIGEWRTIALAPALPALPDLFYDV